MYTFLFDRKSLALLLGGAAVAGALLFAAGVLVGLRLDLPPRSGAVAEFEGLAGFEGGLIKSAGAAPAQPAAAAPASGGHPGSATPAEPPPAATAAPAAPDRQPSPPPVEPARPAVQAPPAAEPVATVPPPAQSADPGAEPAQATPATSPPAAAAEPAASGACAAVTDGSGYYVQVGAYGLAANARRQIQALVSEGFGNAYLATLRTSSGGSLSAVRIGDYATRAEALEVCHRYLDAAPGREAIVRPPR